MEGFVFDLQRFANNYNWPYVLSADFNGQNYYYEAEQEGNYWKITNNVFANPGSMTSNVHYVRVYSDATSYNYDIRLVYGTSDSESSNYPLELDFSAVTSNLGRTLTVSGANLNLLKLPSGTTISRGYGSSGTTTASIQDNATVKFNIYSAVKSTVFRRYHF